MNTLPLCSNRIYVLDHGALLYQCPYHPFSLKTFPSTSFFFILKLKTKLICNLKNPQKTKKRGKFGTDIICGFNLNKRTKKDTSQMSLALKQIKTKI